MQFKGTSGEWFQGTDLRQIESVGGTIVCTVVGAATNESVQADAKLIASAPDLLEALINANALNPCEMYAAAIEKAIGQTVKRTR